MGLMVNISEPRLRKQIRSMLREGAIGYEPLGSDSAWNLQYDICKQVSVLLRKKLASKDAQDAYDAIGVVTKLLKLGLEDRYSSLLANDTKLQDAIKKAFERLRNDHDWIKQWDDEHEITHAVKCAEVEYDEIMGAYHGRGQARDAAYKRLFESDSDYEPLNSDSAFDFQSEVFDAALDLIKERLLDKRGQNAYDGIGAMNYFLEKNLGNCPLFLEDKGGKVYDEAVKQAFKTVRADKEWINAWKDPDMLLAAIDSAEKKYEELKGMYLVLYKKSPHAIKLGEAMVRKAIRAKLMLEYYNQNIDVDEIDDINYTIDSVPDDEDIATAIQEEFGGNETSEEQKTAFIRCFITGSTVYSLECGNYDYHDQFFDGTYDELENVFGEGIANAIASDLNRIIGKLPGRYLNYDTLYTVTKNMRGNVDDILSGKYSDKTVDMTDVDAVNRLAKAKFRNIRGAESEYLLTDGEMIALIDHVYIDQIGQTKASFMSLGNIRVGHGSMGMMKKPTPEQLSVIRDEICPRYYGKKLEVHFCIYREGDREPYPDHIVTYYNPATSLGRKRVVNDIINYYDTGVKPLDRNFD